MKYDCEQIGKSIREERKKLGWTQEKLGKMLHITGKQISNYENGKLLPPQEVLLEMARLFNCEYGYLLGEESYKDRTKLNTAVCESLGLSGQAIEALRGAAHKGLAKDLAERQRAINSLFESPYFGEFIDCLVEAVKINRDLNALNEVIYQKLITRYGERIVNQAAIYCSFNEAIPAATTGDPIFQEVVKEIELAIDKNRTQEYAQKVARYELRESFERLVRSIQ